MRTRWMNRVVLLLGCVLLCLLTACSPGAEQEAIPEGREVITLGCLIERDVAQFVTAFNEAQDEIYVQIRDYYDETGTVSYENGIQQMYTSMVTGETPDLIFLRRLDEGALLKAGLLIDILPLMEADADFHEDEYLTHIWDLHLNNGCLYQICASFYFYGVEAPKEVLGDRHGWTLAEFKTFLEENPGELYVEQGNMLECMLRYGVQGDFISLEDRTCDFTSSEFMELLAFLEDCPQKEGDDWSRIGGFFQSVSVYSRYVKSDGISLRYTGFPTRDRQGPAVCTHDSFGISARTTRQDACWTFLKWMLSAQAQQMLYAENPYELPMRRDLLADTMRRAQIRSDQEESLFYPTVEGVHQTVYFDGVSAEDVAYLEAMIAQADRTAFRNDDITMIVEEEIRAFLAGDKTAEECAHLIQSRVSIMLAEME